MKNITQPVKSLLFIALILGFLTTLITPRFIPAVSAAAPFDNMVIDQNGAAGLTAFLLDAKDKKFKVLKGDAAKLRANQLRTKDKAFNRAIKDLEKLNKKINWEASVVYLEDTEATSASLLGTPTFSPVSLKSPLEVDAYGNEMVSIATAGDQSYWDGTFYVHDAETGNSDTYNAVVSDFNSDDPEGLTVTDELYYPPDGGSPYREQPAYPGYTSPYETLQTRDGYYMDQQMMARNNDGSQKKAEFSKASYTLTGKAKTRKFFSYIWHFTKCLGKCSYILSDRAGCAGIAATATRDRFSCFIAQAANAAFRCARQPSIRDKPQPNTCTFN